MAAFGISEIGSRDLLCAEGLSPSGHAISQDSVAKAVELNARGRHDPGYRDVHSPFAWHDSEGVSWARCCDQIKRPDGYRRLLSLVHQRAPDNVMSSRLYSLNTKKEAGECKWAFC